MSDRDSASRLSAADVAKVARLARLNVSPEEIDRYTRQLDGMLDHFADIDSLDLSDEDRDKIYFGNAMKMLRLRHRGRD